MKYILKCLIGLLLATCTLLAVGCSDKETYDDTLPDCFTMDGISYKRTSVSTVMVVKNDNYSGDIVIPDSVTYGRWTYKVTEMETGCFANNSHIHAVTIPNSITTIPDFAFEGSSVAIVNMHNRVTSIGKYCFAYCDNIESLCLPESISSISVGQYFYSGLNQIIIPEQFTTIHDSAFLGCGLATDIRIPQTVTYIGENAFARCGNIDTYVMDNPALVIKGQAFFYTHIRKLTLKEYNFVVSPNPYDYYSQSAFHVDYIDTISFQLHGRNLSAAHQNTSGSDDWLIWPTMFTYNNQYNKKCVFVSHYADPPTFFNSSVSYRLTGHCKKLVVPTGSREAYSNNGYYYNWHNFSTIEEDENIIPIL